MAPLASATDIFGGLWHVKAVFESATKPNSPTSQSRTIWIFSDMMNETKAFPFPMPELIALGPERMLERAKENGLMLTLPGHKVMSVERQPPA